MGRRSCRLHSGTCYLLLSVLDESDAVMRFAMILQGSTMISHRTHNSANYQFQLYPNAITDLNADWCGRARIVGAEDWW